MIVTVGGSATFTVLDAPVTDEVTVSVAVIVQPPAVLRVALNVPVPLVSVEFAGRMDAPSLLVKCTVPL
jgi:hypothetical protein